MTTGGTRDVVHCMFKHNDGGRNTISLTWRQKTVLTVVKSNEP